MSKTLTWIKAFRLRTLPLSLSGIIAGSFVAFAEGFWDNGIFALAILTTLFLQILSNLANDLGDSQKGADNESRVGPQRAIQSGVISQKEMKFAIALLTLFSLTTAVPLIIIGTQGMSSTVLITYMILAVASITAAITYTIGKKAYGYSGLGDLMVLIFFGFTSVMGVYSLFTKIISWDLILLSLTIGLLSVAVLNLNNMRDHKNDKAVNKNTLVVKIGFKQAKIYHSILITTSLISLIIFIINREWYTALISLLPYLILLKHLSFVWKTTDPKALDPELKKVALSTFFIVILFSLTLVLWN